MEQPGSQERVEALYRQFGPAIFRRCLKLLRDPAEAEDATQEVFVRVFRSLDRFTYGDSALPWIYQIATRLCLHRLRDGSRRDVARARLSPQQEAGGDLGRALADRQTASRLLARFDERTALIALHALVDGMTQEEVGQALGLSRKTVGLKLNHFVERARALLGSAPGSTP
ncbi:MAG TPA: sigma-70 family RNA polymerase sigma factor [Myxococcales bacterium]|nr:sigma-70 family RNA polymerase sigma factor [Myxococcales bacterium]